MPWLHSPIDQLEGVIWYDGKLVPWAEANVHVLTHGLHYASAVFEGERAYGGEIFKCDASIPSGCKRSAQMLDFEIPYSVAEIDAAKQLVLEKNGQKDAYVRPIAWRGSEMMGVSAQNNTIHLAIASGNGRAISIRSSGSRASGSISPNIAGPIRRPRRAARRPPAST